MPQDDKFLMILEKLSDIGERTARMEADQNNMKENLKEVMRQDDIQNQLLAEHIQGVKTANARLDNEIKVRETLESRVEKLEEPSQFLATAKKYVLYIAAVGGAIAAIFKWFHH